MTAFKNLMRRALNKAPAAVTGNDDIRLRALVEGSIQGIVIVRVEENLRPLFVNEAAAQTAGFDSAAEMLALPSLRPLVPRSTLAEAREVWQALLHGGVPSITGETRFRRRDGASIYVKVRNTLVAWDGRPALQMTFIDITRQKQATRNAVAREAMLELALEAAKLGAWSIDCRTGRIDYSASRSTLYDLPASRVSSNTELFLERIHPDDRERVDTVLKQALISDPGQVALEFRVRRRDGGWRWVTSRARVERNTAGRPLRLIGVDIDTTEEHELRERLTRSNAELERFAATVAHDLKSPLQTVIGFGGLLARSAAARLSEDEREQLGFIIEAMRQMSEVIDGVFLAALAEQNDDVETVDLEEAFAQCLLRLGTDIRQAGASITHSRLPRVCGNRVLLTQALQNLLANALKYRADRPLYIHVSAERRDAEWVLSVRDNGIGVARDQQVDLFAAFTRGGNAGGPAGLGLGLALVKSAVERHGGRVWLESTPGEGSTFFFAVPDRPGSDQSESSSVAC